MEQKILEKLKMVKFGDLIHIFKFLFALLPAMFFRKKHKDLWLICDYEMEARDNPYWLFRYICKHHPEQEVSYLYYKNTKMRMFVCAVPREY